MILSQPILRARDTIVASFSGQKLPSILAFTIILLASTQLGLHFWPDSTLVHGIRIDYLSPVIYFLDVLILAYLVASRTLLNRNSRLQVEKGSPAGERRVLIGSLWFPLLLTVFGVALTHSRSAALTLFGIIIPFYILKNLRTRLMYFLGLLFVICYLQGRLGVLLTRHSLIAFTCKESPRRSF